MKRFILSLFTLGLIATHFSISADTRVIYKSGDIKVDMKGDGTWTEVLTDMQLSRSAIVKTGFDGIMEIDIDGERVVIGTNKYVRLGNIYEKVQEKKKMVWFSDLKRIINSVIGAGTREESAISLGIRGAEEDEEEILWMGDIEEERINSAIQQGIELYERNQYAEVVSLFTPVVKDEDCSQRRGEVSFYLGSSLFHNYEYAEALPYLHDSLTDRGAYYHEAAMMHLGFAYYFSEKYRKAIGVFEEYIDEYREGEFRSFALLMMGKSYLSLEDKGKAEKYFLEIKAKYGNTEVYDDAMEELRKL